MSICLVLRVAVCMLVLYSLVVAVVVVRVWVCCVAVVALVTGVVRVLDVVSLNAEAVISAVKNTLDCFHLATR